jgi:hypothetical protein
VRRSVDQILKEMTREFDRVYSQTRTPLDCSGTPAEGAAAAGVSIRSERLLMEQLDYNLLFRWFVGLGIAIRCGITRCSARIASGC